MTWVRRSTGLPASYYLSQVRYAGGVWVVTAAGGAIITSRDSVNWTISRNPSPPEFGLSYLASDGAGVWVGGGLTYSRPSGPDYPETLVVSTDNAQTWTQIDTPAFAGQVWGLAYGNGRFILAGRTFPNGTTEVPQLATSTDGVNWTAQTTSFTPYSVQFGGGKFLTDYDPLYGTIGLGIDSRMAYSSDGVNWTIPTSRVFNNPTEFWSSWSYGDGLWLGYSYNTWRVATSRDGINWTVGESIVRKFPTFAIPFGKPRYQAGKWRIPGQGVYGTTKAPIFVSSDNGATWSIEWADMEFPLSNPYYPSWVDVFGAAGRWVVIGQQANLATLEESPSPLNITTDAVETWHNIGTRPGRLKLYGPGGWFVEKRDSDAEGREVHTLRVWDGTSWQECCQMQLPN